VKVLQKLGDVEIDANNIAEARRYMLAAIELAQAKGIDNLMKRGLIDLGNTYFASGDYAEAEKYFKQSLDLAQRQKDPRKPQEHCSPSEVCRNGAAIRMT
jgi:tetratricopeptide (TPR) repeat protein